MSVMLRSFLGIDDIDGDVQLISRAARAAGRPRALAGPTPAPARPADRRLHLRWPVFWPATLSDGLEPQNCVVLDFSPSGAKVRLPPGTSLDPIVTLSFPGGIGLVGAMAWQHGNLHGVAFNKVRHLTAELVASEMAA